MKRPFTSVLLKAAIFLPSAMAAWWFLLKRPSLWLLEKLAYIPLGVLVAPAGHPYTASVRYFSNSWSQGFCVPDPLHEAKAELFRNIGHPIRIRVLELLCEREHAVHEQHIGQRGRSELLHG